MRQEIEERLIGYSVMIFKLSRQFGKEFYGKYLINQLLRSSASADRKDWPERRIE